VTLLALAGEVGARLAGWSTPWPDGLVTVLVAVAGGLAAWRLPRAAWRRWRFELAPDALELRHGIVERIHSAIPYYRLQYVDIKQGPIERALGLARLVVHTAAAESDAEIPGIAAAEADELRQVLLARAGTGDAV
jgi:membrane protein YdbS with pleckstrin-like domain